MDRATWDIVLLRCFFIVLIAALAAYSHPFHLNTAVSAACAGVAAAVGVWLESRLRHAPLPAILGGALGLFAGALLGLLFVLSLTPSSPSGASAVTGTLAFFRIAAPVALGYLGLRIGSSRSGQISLDRLGIAPDSQIAFEYKILDTSVLIDGRIAEVAEAGFMDGMLVVPQFVLHELQLVADSSDSARRNRGRRGLDIVQRLQKIPTIHLEVSTQDFPNVREVDLKLIEWAKWRKAKIVTNDFNLNKLAQVQGVQVLNLNELANALKPVVLPGESMRVFVLKEGKEYNQGVAYLDDGTMVVVDNARRQVSKTVDITVTSVLQTTAGKMIFGKYDERSQPSSPERAAAAAGSGTPATGK
ncbi:MAG TPA: PIN domain-containing protein [Bryobacteraceae bacterium]|nr:PIN domain-containing protein [Bryobacteraceae bacterium]